MAASFGSTMTCRPGNSDLACLFGRHDVSWPTWVLRTFEATPRCFTRHWQVRLMKSCTVLSFAFFFPTRVKPIETEHAGCFCAEEQPISGGYVHQSILCAEETVAPRHILCEVESTRGTSHRRLVHNVCGDDERRYPGLSAGRGRARGRERHVWNQGGPYDGHFPMDYQSEANAR